MISEALSLGCTEYDQTHKFLDSPMPDTSTYKTTNLDDVFAKVQQDCRFDGYSEYPGFANFFALIPQFESEVTEHWNALVVENTTEQFKDWLKTAAVLTVSTANAEGQFDFYFAHVLTVGHALRILFPIMPEDQRLRAMKQFALFAILIYLLQLRPDYGIDLVTPFKEEKCGWDTLYSRSLESKWSTDLHWPKVIRALKTVEDLRGPEDGFYQQAAAKFIAEFNGWGGFGLGPDAIP